jgi:membrane dipeptidase
LVERDATIGIMPFNDYLLRDWRHRGGRGAVSLNRVVAHIDYICQMAGDAHHVGLGTAFDGGFGLPSVPAEIDTIADLQKLVPLLLGRGYTEEDVAAILGLNWISFLRATLP